MQQAYGNITIKVPELPENASTEELCNNKALIEELINTVVRTQGHLNSLPFSIIFSQFFSQFFIVFAVYAQLFLKIFLFLPARIQIYEKL